jgi:hypothetical protein
MKARNQKTIGAAKPMGLACLLDLAFPDGVLRPQREAEQRPWEVMLQVAPVSDVRTELVRELLG